METIDMIEIKPQMGTTENGIDGAIVAVKSSTAGNSFYVLSASDGQVPYTLGEYTLDKKAPTIRWNHVTHKGFFESILAAAEEFDYIKS